MPCSVSRSARTGRSSGKDRSDLPRPAHSRGVRINDASCGRAGKWVTATAAFSAAAVFALGAAAHGKAEQAPQRSLPPIRRRGNAGIQAEQMGSVLLRSSVKENISAISNDTHVCSSCSMTQRYPAKTDAKCAAKARDGEDGRGCEPSASGTGVACCTLVHGKKANSMQKYIRLWLVIFCDFMYNFHGGISQSGRCIVGIPLRFLKDRLAECRRQQALAAAEGAHVPLLQQIA